MMRISDRYRMVFDAVTNQRTRMRRAEQEINQRALDCLVKALDELGTQLDVVGEIPQMKLEQRLSPVLLSSHALLDRARVLLETAEDSENAAAVWELEQQIYRLLNDL